MRRTARSLLSFAIAATLVASFAPVAYAAPGAAGSPESTGASTDAETAGVLVVLEDDAEGISLLSEGDAANGTDAASGVAGALEDANLEVSDAFEAGGASVVVAEPTDGSTDEEAAEAAAQIPGVAYAQPNYVYGLIDGVEDGALAARATAADDAAATLAAPLFDDPIAQIADPDASPNSYWLYSANIDDAWQDATCDGTVTVAAFDSGAMLEHVDLADNLIADLAWDSYNKAPLDSSQFTGGDNGGHGTHVAGIISAVANNGTGIAGASYNAKVLPVKAVSDASRPLGYTSSLVAAYEYLFGLIDDGSVENVRVVNISMGSYADSFNDPLLEAAIETARDSYGIVTVCAGGNGDQSSTPNTQRIYPADLDACVSVTALEKDGTNIPYSDYNEWKDISAPGRDVWSTYIRNSESAGGYYTSLSGTSMASPVVAGTFALLFAAVPDATVDEAIEAVTETATPVVDPENDRSETSGSAGAIDADAALDYLIENHKPTFPDVPDGEWYAEAVAYVAQRGIMTGYDGGPDEGKFVPGQPMTRAMIAQVLYNYYGEGEIAPATSHTDVDQGQWYAEAVNWVVSEQMMTGDAGLTTFRPDDTLTREELAIVFDNVSAVETVANPGAFEALPDHESTSSWAVEEVTWAVGNGVINGVEVDPAGNPGYRILDPQGTTNRAMVAVVLMNALEGGIL